MSDGVSGSNIAAVPEDVHQSLLKDRSDVETKLGHVAKFDRNDKTNDLEDNIILQQLVHVPLAKDKNEFVGLSKEELKSYINNPKWKRIHTNNDAIGDIQGLEDKLSYLKKNNIKSILLRSSIFNVTSGRSIELDGKNVPNQRIDFLTIDPVVGSEDQLNRLAKILNRKDMHLIIDLPISSTDDPNGNSWYGSPQSLAKRINNPCLENPSDLGCNYYQSYGQLPLDFNDPIVVNRSKYLIEYWLLKKKFDGVRVPLPLALNGSNRSYKISSKTIDEWNEMKSNIEKKSKAKLLMIDVPFALQNQMSKKSFREQTAHPLLLFTDRERTPINARNLAERLKLFEKNQSLKGIFWQLGSERRSDEIGLVHQNELKKEFLLTMVMLVGGTPIILYGEEIHSDQTRNGLMAWSSDPVSGGFTSCSSVRCKEILSSYKIDSSRTNVKRAEAAGGGTKDSLLKVFRHLSKLRQSESFQFGLFQSGFDEKLNLFWFIREAPGHRGYIIVLNLNEDVNDVAHVSLQELTKHDVPLHIHLEYQWPNSYFGRSNESHINSDNILIHPQSLNIFWWKAKLLKPKSLFDKAKEHSKITE